MISNRSFVHVTNDFIKMIRYETITIGAYIHDLSRYTSWLSMHMTVNVPGTTVDTIPFPDREVTQHYLLSIDRDLSV